jgi:FHA domain/IPT/TIG domain
MATSWHLTSLTVLGGTLHGKKLTIEDVVVEVLIGSDSDCHLHLDLPTVSPIHARLWIEPDDVTVYGTRSGPGVFVNFDRIDGDGKLRPGDLLWLGPPQAAGSVMLQVQFEERDTLPQVAPQGYDEALEAEVEPAVPAHADTASAAEAAEPLALEAMALGESPSIPTPASQDPAAMAGPPLAETGPPEEPLGVLPEDSPAPLQVALRALQSEVPPSRPEVRPAVAIVQDPPTETSVGGFEDFLVMDAAPPAAPSPPAHVDEFVVAGFDADWPETPEPERAAGARVSPAPLERPNVPAPPAGDDVFFIDDAVVSESDQSFFIDDGGAASTPIVSPMPMASSGEASAAHLDDFAAAFLEESPPTPRPAAVAPPPVVKPAATPPVTPKPAPPPVASAPPSPRRPSPSVSQTVPPSAVPPRSPSATNAVRPLARPDVSQSVSRGDRPQRPDRTQAVRPRRPAARPIGRYAVMGAVTLAVLGGIGFLVSTLTRSVRLDSVEPPRARVGDTVALVGRGFAASPGDNVVLFDDKPANVTTATPTRLEVVVPDVANASTDGRARVRVRVGRAESPPVEVSVFSGPVLHGISPDVAMPGDEVVLAGSGWGLAPTVRFGGLAAEVSEARETSIRVRVPAIDGGPGTAAPVVVTSGSLDSNQGPFYVGHIPLVTKADPTSLAPGDVVTLTGRGFRREPSQNTVQVGGARALVVSAFDSEIKVVIPRLPAGSRMLEVRVPSSGAPAQVPLVVSAADTFAFHFVAEPFDAVPGRDHAVLATELGPAFVLASSGGRSAAERALEAARRLNEAAQALKASRELTFDLRDADSKPSLGLAGRPELIIEVTDEDAAAYGEDWTGLHGRGGAVTTGRLGRWWEAVAKDLVLLLLRGEKPHFAADLAPEGRALVDFFQAAQHAGQAAPVTTRDALRIVALRVPPGVRGPAALAPVSAPSATAPATPPPSTAQSMPRLDGAWTGSETEGGRLRYVTVTFRGSTGTIAYEGVVTVSAPLLNVAQPQRGAARFSVELRGGLRYYVGHWDGQVLSGNISTDPGGSQSLGTFELRPR